MDSQQDRLLPSHYPSDDVKANTPQARPACRRRKTVLFYLLAFSAMMYVAYSAIPRFRLRFPQGIWGPSCHRKFTAGNLPSHHMLASRDAIPSVALGNEYFVCYGFPQACLLSRSDRTGVWRAGSGEVREAVKVLKFSLVPFWLLR
jgi:hypothetical protein